MPRENWIGGPLTPGTLALDTCDLRPLLVRKEYSVTCVLAQVAAGYLGKGDPALVRFVDGFQNTPANSIQFGRAWATHMYRRIELNRCLLDEHVDRLPWTTFHEIGHHVYDHIMRIPYGRKPTHPINDSKIARTVEERIAALTRRINVANREREATTWATGALREFEKRNGDFVSWLERQL